LTKLGRFLFADFIANDHAKLADLDAGPVVAIALVVASRAGCFSAG